MGISQYLKEIGRGQQGARSLSREQAADLFGLLLDGTASDLELGAFCIAMRVKGETPEEMAGFLDATRARLALVPPAAAPVVVLPSYNGARRLPVLTPLLALLLAQRGLPVLMHGSASEDKRLFITDVLPAVGVSSLDVLRAPRPGEAVYAATELLHPGLKRLLDVRRVLGLRNSAHSLVKLMDPCAGPAVIVGSYTHPEYAVSMGAVFELMGSTAMLLRGTEGEVVADARRTPQMEGFVRGRRIVLEDARRGTLSGLPGWPSGVDPGSTAAYIRDVLHERQPVPDSIALQVEHIVRLAADAAEHGGESHA